MTISTTNLLLLNKESNSRKRYSHQLNLKIRRNLNGKPKVKCSGKLCKLPEEEIANQMEEVEEA